MTDPGDLIRGPAPGHESRPGGDGVTDPGDLISGPADRRASRPETGGVTDPGAYCREIESYLCRCNGGHLIRIVGPAFEQVRGWAEAGVPLGVVTAGIDRRLARYRATGPHRRPLRIEFCAADVLDAFDEWRRAVGLVAAPGHAPAGGDPDHPAGAADTAERRVRSGRRLTLPKHVDRILEGASNRLAREEMPPGLRAALTRLVTDVDALRPSARGARGPSRRAVVERLDDIDGALLVAAREAAGPDLADLEADARAELSSFRSRLDADAFARAVRAATDRLLRRRLGLPAVRFEE